MEQRTRKPKPLQAIKAINQAGALLVFPIRNQKEPPSLWSHFYPRQAMKWEWNDDGDTRVANMWTLMKGLSDSRDVVYTKWYQGRATFFSRQLFTALLAFARNRHQDKPTPPWVAQQLLEILESDSPLSTKQLKIQAELQGRENEAAYTKGLKWLFDRFLVVAFGEVEDGAFPSLAIGATQLLFEDLWTSAEGMPILAALELLNRSLPPKTPLRAYLEKQWGQIGP